MKDSALTRLASGFLALVMLLWLAGCGGGGGGSGSSPFGGAKTPTLTLALSASTVTAGVPVTVTATVRDGDGRPVAGIVVSLSVTRPELGVLSAATALTDQNGEARVSLTASNTGTTGADDLNATATVGNATVQARVGYSVTGATPVLSLTPLDGTTLSNSRGPLRFTATLTSATGEPMGGIVNFSSVGGKVRLSQASGLAPGPSDTTDASKRGRVTVTALPVDPTTPVADTIRATATVGGRDLEARINVAIEADPPRPDKLASLMLSIESPELLATRPTGVTVTALDANRNLLPDVVVTLSTDTVDLATLSATSARTGANGEARFTISPINSLVRGAGYINARATFGTPGALTSFETRVGFSVPGPTVTLSAEVNPTTILAQAGPATVTATLLDTSKNPPVGIAGQPVRFSSISYDANARGFLTFSPESVLTDSAGIARTTAVPADPAATTAGTVTASATAGRQLQSTVNVQVKGNSGPLNPTLRVDVTRDVTSSVSGTVTVTLLDANSNPVPGVVVEVRATGPGVLGASSVLTDASGSGRVGLTVPAAAAQGAGVVVASARVGTRDLSDSKGYSASRGVATIQARTTASTLGLSRPAATFEVRVADAGGTGLAGQLVTFSSTTRAVRVVPESALTDSDGKAQATITAEEGASGLDTLVASWPARQLQASADVQVLAERPSIVLQEVPSVIASGAGPVTVRAVVRDANGELVPNAVVSFSSRLGVFSVPSVATQSTGLDRGSATVLLRPASSTTSGSDVIGASVTIGGFTRTDQRAVSFVLSAAQITPSVVLNLVSPTVATTAPTPFRLQVLDGWGKGINGVVVRLATARGNLASPSANSVVTSRVDGVDGVATGVLTATGQGVEGADLLTATATVAGQTVQDSKDFRVSGEPALKLETEPAGRMQLRASDNPATRLTVTVVNPAGGSADGARVTFSGTQGLTRITPSSAIVSNGKATVDVVPLNPTLDGAEILEARTNVGGRELVATRTMDLVRESPSIELTAPSYASSIGSPSTVKAVVKDFLGVAQPNVVVQFDTVGGLGVFSSASALTAPSGGTAEAQVFLSPARATAEGADFVRARATFNGVELVTTRPVQFTRANSVPGASLKATISPADATISSVRPGTVTATLTDGRGNGVAGQAVGFTVVRGLARTDLATVLTDSLGRASTTITPTASSAAGADEVVASVNFAGTVLSDTRGFQVTATNVIPSWEALAPGFTLSAYGQQELRLFLRDSNGVNIDAPVNINIVSSCVSQGKATISPLSFTTQESPQLLQYRDNGCGVLQGRDRIQAVVVGSPNVASIELPLSAPSASSIAFVEAKPETIYLKGTGLAETSTLAFEVRDVAGNPLPNQEVQLTLRSSPGGLTMEGNPSGVTITRRSNADGRVFARVNSGTVPTPVRVQASITPAGGGSAISTVSSNLSVAVGFPSQVNFSLAQGTRNIEGYSRNGERNTYSIIASDRSGNPVPAGTAINFVTEGGSIEAIKRSSGALGAVTAEFITADPRPLDGRITITAYAIGEESFLDLNGNNVYDAGERFQDLGEVFLDRNFDGRYDPSVDEVIFVRGSWQGSTCQTVTSPPATLEEAALLRLDPSIPSTSVDRTDSCDGEWSRPGRVYVRRATETVLSTSNARPLWASVSGLEQTSCTASAIRLQTGPQVLGQARPSSQFARVRGETWYSTAPQGVLGFIVADANPGRLIANPTLLAGTGSVDLSLDANWEALPRLNPMAAGTTVQASSPTTGLTVAIAGGSPVGSTSEATFASVSYSFTDPAVSRGVVTVNFISPSGASTTATVTVDRSRDPLNPCILGP